MRVTVYGSPKTCRGFISSKDSRLHILCNIARFATASESDQYRLIHHEYAGLMNLENNDQAASDYSISSQISDFLTSQRVLKLSVVKIKDLKLSSQCIDQLNKVIKIKKSINSFSYTQAEFTSLIEMNENAANSVALTCAGIKGLELQKSFKARIGLLSHDEADDIMEQVHQDAMKYYYKYSR